VRAVQFFLLGADFRGVGKADGKFGPKTKIAVQDFQQSMDLDSDGLVGPKTLAQMMLAGLDTLEDDREEQISASWPPAPPDLLFPSLTRVRQMLGGKLYRYERLDAAGNIKILGKWEEQNIVTVQVPELAEATEGKYTRMRVHKSIVGPLCDLWSAWKAAGLLHLVKTYEGAFVPRLIRGGNSLSNHAFGLAFDINYQWNMLGHQPALANAFGTVRPLVPLANKHGFYWGGHYSGRKDGMHMEATLTL